MSGATELTDWLTTWLGGRDSCHLYTVYSTRGVRNCITSPVIDGLIDRQTSLSDVIQYKHSLWNYIVKKYVRAIWTAPHDFVGLNDF